MALRQLIRRLKREASKDAVLLYQRDGSVKTFDVMTVWRELFLTRMDLLRGEARRSEVLDAVRSATEQSRRNFEQRYGPLEMKEHVVESNSDDAWVREYRLLEDGSIEKTFYDGGSEEARRVLQEARKGGPKAFF